MFIPNFNISDTISKHDNFSNCIFFNEKTNFIDHVNQLYSLQ